MNLFFFFLGQNLQNYLKKESDHIYCITLWFQLPFLFSQFINKPSFFKATLTNVCSLFSFISSVPLCGFYYYTATIISVHEGSHQVPRNTLCAAKLVYLPEALVNKYISLPFMLSLSEDSQMLLEKQVGNRSGKSMNSIEQSWLVGMPWMPAAWPLSSHIKCFVLSLWGRGNGLGSSSVTMLLINPFKRFISPVTGWDHIPL